ncbi:MAG TPA: hypothetical protein VJH96_02760 [Patescibacteria group bacterium]|nr:hypothetical protein [Patescibacteria group bacterium]
MIEEKKSTPQNPQIVFSWTAPLRAYKKRGKGIIRFYLALSLLLALIAFFFGDKVLILPIGAIMFLFYVLTTTSPTDTTHKITTFGIEMTGNTIRWELLSHFYFIRRFDYQVLVLVAVAPFFYHLYLVINDETTKNKLIEILSQHLIYQEHPRKTLTDRAGEWISRLMPQDEEVKKEAPPIGP